VVLEPVWVDLEEEVQAVLQVTLAEAEAVIQVELVEMSVLVYAVIVMRVAEEVRITLEHYNQVQSQILVWGT
jgi:hypothetical protein